LDAVLESVKAAALFGAHPAQARLDDAEERGPAMRASDRSRDRADLTKRVGRDRERREVPARLPIGTSDLEKRQQMIRAVVVEKIVIEISRPHLPGVIEKALDLLRREIELVLPEIPALDVRVDVGLEVVGRERVEPRVEADQPLDRVPHPAVGSGKSL